MVPLRRTLLYLSHHRGLRRVAETSSLARRLASRFVAGDTLEDALRVCTKIREQGITATLDYLGENVTSLEEAAACRDVYCRTLRSMKAAGLEPNVSLKLTQFGLDLSPEACEANVAQLVHTAAQIGGFVRFDMESSEYTDRTLSLVTRLHARFGACGTVIQAYLRRSAGDVNCLSRERIRVRLCKGAYLEAPEVAFPDKRDVDRNYLELARTLLADGPYPAIATHDVNMIAGVKQFASAQGIARDRFEFQMLFGIRRDLQRQLILDGYRLRVYIPFGEAWYPYFMRRLAERPANLLFLLKNLGRS
jgi:proline dehydrogenase